MPSYDMKDEKKPMNKKLLPEGWRRFVVLSAKEDTSSKGNKMIVATLQDEITGQSEDCYMITPQGKRWYLKAFLAACGVPVADGEVYSFEFVDLVGKIVGGLVEHFQDDWIDRENKPRTTTKHKIADFREEAQF